jgi:single-strand DNA-binding protein
MTTYFVGNLGDEPTMRVTPSGQNVCNFPVASNRSFTNSAGEKVKETTWYRVEVWGKLAEVCNQYLRKGREVMIEGRLKPDPVTGGPRIWNRQDGTPGASFEIVAHEVRFLGSGNGAPTGDVEATPDEIPF